MSLPDRRQVASMKRGTRTAAMTQAQALQELAFRVRCLRPDHRNPERFHIEKSEIEHELRQLAAGAI